MKPKPTKIGVISDTHGLLREEALDALHGSELIIHAGDIGGSKIIEMLSRIAGVVAVRGNTDRDGWGGSLPATAVVEAAGALIYVLHDMHALELDPAAARFQIVISGHSHRPSRSLRDGVLYLNPGSAGPKRFDLPNTLARINLTPDPWEIDFADLSGTHTKRQHAR